MGKTKTAVISGASAKKELSGAEKYKLKQQKKAEDESGTSSSTSGSTIEESKDDSKAGLSPKAKRGVRIRGKKHNDNVAKIDSNTFYSPAEAIKLVKETSYSSFDGTFELHAVVKKDGLTTQVTLPHSGGKEKSIEVATEKTLAKLEKGTVDFDVLLATPDMMPKLVKFARILGPKGLMPNPKNGTLIKDTKDAKNYSANALTVKTERKAPVIHVPFGKVSQSDKELLANLEAIITTVGKRQFVKATICASMSPSVKLKIA